MKVLSGFNWSGEDLDHLLSVTSRERACRHCEVRAVTDAYSAVSPAERSEMETNLGIRFASLVSEHDQAIVVSASELLRAGPVPQAGQTLDAFARTIVLIASPDDAIDVSFSLPEYPTSIFLSVPSKEVPAEMAVARAAEALLHESLHLQLSAVEAAMLESERSRGDFRSYSPWKRELRPLGGLLHGLYVFGHLRAFWAAFLRDGSFGVINDFARKRSQEIALQIAQVKAEWLPFTSSERALVDRALHAFPNEVFTEEGLRTEDPAHE